MMGMPPRARKTVKSPAPTPAASEPETMSSAATAQLEIIVLDRRLPLLIPTAPQLAVLMRLVREFESGSNGEMALIAGFLDLLDGCLATSADRAWLRAKTLDRSFDTPQAIQALSDYADLFKSMAESAKKPPVKATSRARRRTS